MAKAPEYCTCASIRLEDGREFDGYRHDRCYRIVQAAGLPAEVVHNATQGFRTSYGRFVDRVEGMQIQRASGLQSRYSRDGVYRGDELFSEDLY